MYSIHINNIFATSWFFRLFLPTSPFKAISENEASETVNSRMASNYQSTMQLSHLRPCRESNPGLRGGRRECYHSATMAPTVGNSNWAFFTKIISGGGPVHACVPIHAHP